jgi:antitoxin component YwqK of YwqJK toxin-antitoxin module
MRYLWNLILKEMQLLRLFVVFMMIAAGTITCNSGQDAPETREGDQTEKMVRRHRDDGTLSSINPVDEDGYVHGVKINYYEDGTHVHSKITYDHGRKHGPAIWYYGSGRVYEHTNFHYGKKDGLTKRYYESGELMEEVTYAMGEELPGKKKYDREGNLLSD